MGGNAGTGVRGRPRPVRMRPTAVLRIPLNLVRCPSPCTHVSEYSQGVGVGRAARMGGNREFQGATKERDVVVRVR